MPMESISKRSHPPRESRDSLGPRRLRATRQPRDRAPIHIDADGSTFFGGYAPCLISHLFIVGRANCHASWQTSRAEELSDLGDLLLTANEAREVMGHVARPAGAWRGSGRATERGT